MTDIVRLEDEYYVRASSALADDRTRVLKYGDTFAVFNRYGDIEPLGTSRFGLFHAETRHLSQLTLRLNQKQPLLLSSTIREDNAFLSVDLTNVDTNLNGDGELPRGARPDLTIDGTIELERLDDVIYVGRPAFGQENNNVSIFKLVSGSSEAVRTPVKLGRSSVNSIEIVNGLQPGDQVILSDTSTWDA